MVDCSTTGADGVARSMARSVPVSPTTITSENERNCRKSQARHRRCTAHHQRKEGKSISASEETGISMPCSGHHLPRNGDGPYFNFAHGKHAAKGHQHEHGFELGRMQREHKAPLRRLFHALAVFEQGKKLFKVSVSIVDAGIPNEQPLRSPPWPMAHGHSSFFLRGPRRCARSFRGRDPANDNPWS